MLIYLSGEWVLKNDEYTLAGNVPGDVSDDFIRAGLIKDPYFHDNYKESQWITLADWCYEKTFQVRLSELDESTYLRFDGVDTFSDVYLNGVKIGSTANMHRAYKFPVDGLLKDGDNLLSVRLHNIYDAMGKEEQQKYCSIFHANRIFVRKAQCHFSWDWAPKFPGYGIYRDVVLISEKRAAVESVAAEAALFGIAPTGGWGHNWGSGPAWDCALFFLPYEYYLETGDRSLLELVYDASQKYLSYAKYYRQNGLVCYGLSDWCPPDLPDLKLMDNCLSDSCYYYAMQQIMAKMAEFAGEPEKAVQYRKEAEETKSAIHSRFIQNDCVDNDGQGALAEVLYFRIVEGAQAEKIAAKLAKVVEEDRYSYKVGILGLKALLNALSKYGYTDVAYKTVDRDDYPSYGYWKKLGATTLWECWENTSFGSQNHHMYADVVGWMFRNIGGLQNAGIAYDKCLLKPYFFADSCSASAKTETPNGVISFAWEKTESRFVADVVIPEGTDAILELPGCAPVKVHTGKLEFQL